MLPYASTRSDRRARHFDSMRSQQPCKLFFKCHNVMVLGLPRYICHDVFHLRLTYTKSRIPPLPAKIRRLRDRFFDPTGGQRFPSLHGLADRNVRANRQEPMNMILSPADDSSPSQLIVRQTAHVRPKPLAERVTDQRFPPTSAEDYMNDQVCECLRHFDRLVSITRRSAGSFVPRVHFPRARFASP